MLGLPSPAARPPLPHLHWSARPPLPHLHQSARPPLPHLRHAATATPPQVRHTKPQARLHPVADQLNCRVNVYTEKQHLPVKVLDPENGRNISQSLSLDVEVRFCRSLELEVLKILLVLVNVYCIIICFYNMYL